ncbi:MAG: hypothetical protein KC561_00795 [Myxococcales bacterium]|nr:hypothetical protein [Myxococcales bacterium]
MLRRYIASLSVLFLLVVAGLAFGQTRSTVAPAQVTTPAIEGTGTTVQERAVNPYANEERQPERSEGNEDDLDINSGDDGSSGGSETQP